MEALVEWLTTPDRLTGILQALHARKALKQGAVEHRIGQLHREAADAEKALQNLYAAIESGILDAGEPSLQGRVADLRGKRDLARAALERARSSLVEQPTLHPDVVETFRRVLVDRLSSGPIEGRKAWLSAVVDCIIVEPGKIRVVGRKDSFERSLRNHAAGRGPVRSSVREWWAGPDHEYSAFSMGLPTASSGFVRAPCRYLPSRQ